MSEETLAENKQIIRGVILPKTSYHTRKKFEEGMDYVPKDRDIITASYPKTGTIWIQYIVIQITSYGKSFPSLHDAFFKTAPSIVMAGVKTVEELRNPRIYRHHFRYNLVQKNPKSKYIYIYRKPEDTLLSYYKYFSDQYGQQWENFDIFFESFLSGEVFYGSYFEHVMSYLEHKDDENLLMISYEDLKSNPRDGILKVAKFLGEEYYQNLLKDESVLETILEKTSFQYMKKNLHFNFHKRWDVNNTFEGEKEVDFFRKGTVGEGKRCLSTHQISQLQKAIKNVMRDPEILDEWISD